MRISKEKLIELNAYAKSLSKVEEAEALPSVISDGTYEDEEDTLRCLCITKKEIDAVYHCLVYIINDEYGGYKNDFCYAISTTTKKSKHEQQLKFAEHMETLSPQDQELELYSLTPLVPNGSNIQRIKDRCREEIEQVLSNASIGKKRKKKLTAGLIKELTNY